MKMRDLAKEFVENRSTEEVLDATTKALKQAFREYDGSEESLWAAGVFASKVSLALAMLEALNEKLAPKEPVVA